MFLNLTLIKEEKIILQTQNIPYTKKDTTIFFEIEGMKHQIDLEKKWLIRENEEFFFFIDLEQEKCTYKLKKEEIELNIIVDDAFFHQMNNTLEINYAIETDDEKIKILIEYIN